MTRLGTAPLLLALCATAAAQVPTLVLNNGVIMPVIAAGTAGYNDSEAAAAVRAAWAANVTAVHTAYDYYNLAGVGVALAELPRERLFLSSMTSPCVHLAAPPVRNVSDPEACEALTAAELDDVLDQLGVAALDLVMLHGPSEPNGYAGPCAGVPCALNAAQWRAYEAFARAGKARAIGVSNFCQSCLACLGLDDGATARARAPTVPAVNQIQYHVGEGADPEGLLGDTAALGSNVQAYSPLASGAVVDDADVQAIADAYGKSAAQVGLRFVLQNAAAPSLVVKASTAEYLAEDIDVFDFVLADADMATLAAKTEPKGQSDGRPSWGCGE